METAESAEEVVVEEAGPVGETAAGWECAGVVTGSVLGRVLVGVGAVAARVARAVGAVAGAVARAEAGSEAVVGAVGGPEAGAVVGEAESELYGRLNAGCGVGDHGSRAAACPLWKPPSSARRRKCVSVT